MRKLFTLFAASALLSMGLVLGQGASPAGAVGACGWYYQGSRSVIMPDGNAQLWLQNVYDGCQHHYYQVQLQSRINGATIQASLHIRVWVCGTFQHDFVWSAFLYSSGSVVTHWTGSYYYPVGCNAQADNYNTVVGTFYADGSSRSFSYPTTYLNF